MFASKRTPERPPRYLNSPSLTVEQGDLVRFLGSDVKMRVRLIARRLSGDRWVGELELAEKAEFRNADCTSEFYSGVKIVENKSTWGDVVLISRPRA